MVCIVKAGSIYRDVRYRKAKEKENVHNAGAANVCIIRTIRTEEVFSLELPTEWGGEVNTEQQLVCRCEEGVVSSAI